MINFDDVTVKSIKERSANWPRILGHLYMILTIKGFGSGKTNTLLNLISCQPHTDKVYLYGKDPCKANYPLVINKHESLGSRHCNDPKTFIKCSNDTTGIYEILMNTIRIKAQNIVFDDMIADMLSNEKT